MANNVVITGEPEIFKLMPRDIDHVFIRANLRGNALSAFKYSATEAEYLKASQWAQAFFQAPVFPRAAKLLLEPDLKITYHTGGGGTAEDTFLVLLRQDVPTLLMISKNSDDDFLGMIFSSQKDFLDWWCGMYSNSVLEECISPFDGNMPLETLVCILHSIDTYRRSYLESMLRYDREQGLTVKRQMFIDTLSGSLASGDIRWFLPSLFRLTPGLTSAQLKLLPENLQVIEQLGFVKSWADQNGQTMFTLGDNGKIIGSEFCHTWMHSIGWQASILVNNQEMMLSRVYLAPTAFTNHLFSFQSMDGGKFNCNHQSLTGVKLRNNLDQWFKTIYEYSTPQNSEIPSQNTVTPVPPAQDAQPVPPPFPESREQERVQQGAAAEAAPPAQNKKNPKCPACGVEIEQGQRFCGVCGTPLPKSNW